VKDVVTCAMNSVLITVSMEVMIDVVINVAINVVTVASHVKNETNKCISKDAWKWFAGTSM